MLKLMIAVPSSGRFVPLDFTFGLLSLQPVFNTSHVTTYMRHPNRAACRTAIVKEAIKMQAEYLLMLDDDTVPPPNTLNQLISVMDQDPEIAVCGGIYTSKTDPAVPLVFMEPLKGSFWHWKAGDVFQCWAIGTGCMMIRTSIFNETFPEPWFQEGVVSTDTAVMHTTDDMFFCQRLAEFGLKVMAHGGVLPVHIDATGKPFVLDPQSVPLRDTDPETLWYRRIVKRAQGQ